MTMSNVIHWNIMYNKTNSVFEINHCICKCIYKYVSACESINKSIAVNVTNVCKCNKRKYK